MGRLKIDLPTICFKPSNDLRRKCDVKGEGVRPDVKSGANISYNLTENQKKTVSRGEKKSYLLRYEIGGGLAL